MTFALRLSRWVLTRQVVRQALKPALARLLQRYDSWVGDSESDQLFRTRNLCTLWGWQVQIHAFLKADKPGWFHSHPYVAFRFVLLGGYIEEVLPERVSLLPNGSEVHFDCQPTYVGWHAGQWGWVDFDYIHRLDETLADSLFSGAPVYTLWIHRAPTRPVKLYNTAEAGF